MGSKLNTFNKLPRKWTATCTCIRVISEATSASTAYNLVRQFFRRHFQAFHLNFTWLLLATTQSATREMVDGALFSRSQGSNVDLISGFSHFFTSNIAWRPFKFFRFVALDRYTRAKGTVEIDLFSMSRGVKHWPNFRVCALFHFTYTRAKDTADIDLFPGHRGSYPWLWACR